MRWIVKAAVKAAKNPTKTARAIDSGIKKAAKVWLKINNAVDERSYKNYKAAATKADKAVGAYNKARWPVERAVLKRAANKAVAKADRAEKRDSKVADAVYKVRDRLSRYAK